MGSDGVVSLEELLRVLEFDRRVSHKIGSSKAPYLLPLEEDNGEWYGLFKFETGLHRHRVGFSYTRENGQVDFYELTLNLQPLRVPARNEDVTYIPLLRSEHGTKLRSEGQDGVWKYIAEVPFQLVSIDGLDQDRSLVYFSATDDDPTSYGLVIDTRGADARESIWWFRSHKNNAWMEHYCDGLYMHEGRVTESLEISFEEYGGVEGHDPAMDVNLTSPQEIVSYLNRVVIGQEEAKKIVSVAFANYMMRMQLGDESLPKENLLLIGPSGSGKTLMLQELAKRAGIPSVRSTMGDKSSEGYIGENLSSMFAELRAKTGDEAPYALVILDEFDKLVESDWDSGGFGARKQDSLIGWVEETTIQGGRKEGLMLNTKNILFVALGAFQGQGSNSLENIIRKRLGQEKKRVGFMASLERTESDEYLMPFVRPEDIISYGIKHELVGRFPMLGVFHPLTEHDKVRILKESEKSVLSSYVRVLETMGYAVEIEEPVLYLIARHCPVETGARALNGVCSDLFTDLRYSPEKYAVEGKIRITEELAQKLITNYGLVGASDSSEFTSILETESR